MRKIGKIGKILFGVVLLFGLLTGAAPAGAHSMTLEEATVYLDKGDGSTGTIKIGDTLGTVSAILGSEYELKDFKGDGIRMVKYVYPDETFFYGRTSQRDTRAEEEIPIKGYTIKNSALHTASGICVGRSYEELAGKFGPGQQLASKYEKQDGLITYIYDLYKEVKEFSVRVDSAGTIKEMAFRQEM